MAHPERNRMKAKLIGSSRADVFMVFWFGIIKAECCAFSKYNSILGPDSQKKQIPLLGNPSLLIASHFIFELEESQYATMMRLVFIVLTLAVGLFEEAVADLVSFNRYLDSGPCIF